MKLKYYLKGIGVGLIVATLILTIAYNVNSMNTQSKIHETDKETEGSVIAYTKENESNAGETESRSASETKPQETTDGEQKTQNHTEEPSKDNTGTETVSVTIKDVYSAIQAADILYEDGVIDNKEEFIKYMAESGYSTKIKEGVYDITKGDTFENIAKIITRTE